MHRGHNNKKIYLLSVVTGSKVDKFGRVTLMEMKSKW